MMVTSGVFTTGLTAIWDLGRWIPSNYGGWYVKGGFQWYDLINNNLVISENESVGCAHQCCGNVQDQPEHLGRLRRHRRALLIHPQLTKTQRAGPNGPRDCFMAGDFVRSSSDVDHERTGGCR